MSFAVGRFLQSVFDACFQAVFAVLGNAQGQGDAVSGQEAHALDVVDEAIRILPDFLLGAGAVTLADLDSQRGGHAVGLQKDHGLPGAELLLIGFGDQQGAFLPDTGHLGQPFGAVGQHVQGVLAKLLYDQLGGGVADAGNQAGKISLDAQQGGGFADLAGIGLPLPAIAGMLYPRTGKQHLFPGHQGGQRAHDRDFVPAHPRFHHGIAVFLIAENGVFNHRFDLRLLGISHRLPTPFRFL